MRDIGSARGSRAGDDGSVGGVDEDEWVEREDFVSGCRSSREQPPPTFERGGPLTRQ